MTKAIIGQLMCIALVSCGSLKNHESQPDNKSDYQQPIEQKSICAEETVNSYTGSFEYMPFFVENGYASAHESIAENKEHNQINENENNNSENDNEIIASPMYD